MKNIIINISFCALLFSCVNETITEQTNEEKNSSNIVTLTQEQCKNVDIETGTLINKNISSLLKVNGKIDVPPQNIVSVSVPLGGYLKSTHLLPGMFINKGEVLAVIEDLQYIQLQQEYLTAKAQLLLIESEYNRQMELNKSKAASDKIFEQAKTNYETHLVLIKSLEQKLLLIGLHPDKINANNISKSINIYSPITGFVTAVNANIGKYITPTEVLFELVDPRDIHLTLSVFEKDINKLSVGQKLLAYTNTRPEKKYKCEIILISRNLTSQGFAEVHCHFEQYDKILLPGMFMNAEIEYTSHPCYVLPEKAVLRYENKQYIFIAKENNQFQMLEIRTGYTENGLVEVINSDSLINQPIVVKGAYNLLMAIKNSSNK
jgi:cobalt-zinc-cadmium efflux system membrane fusion protein